MKRILACLICFFSVNAFSMEIMFPTGNDFYKNCKYLKQQYRQASTAVEMYEVALKFGFCYGSVTTAFDDITNIAYLWSTNSNAVTCFQNHYGFDKFSGQQIFDLTIQYLQKHPEIRNNHLGTIITALIHDNYPFPDYCKKLIKAM